MTATPPGYRFERGFLWPSHDRHCARAVFNTFDDCKLAMSYAAERKLVVQAGGNCGVWASQLSPIFERVVTFEPDPANYRCLVHNTAALGNVLAFPAALAERHGWIDLARERHNCGAHHITSGDALPVMTLDSLKLPALDLIYLDIEGAELLALFGGIETIRRFRPVIGVENKGLGERFGFGTDAIEAFLAAEGYAVVARVNRDLIFAHTEPRHG